MNRFISFFSFTNTTVWKDYELIVAEIVNHLISVISDFGLVIYQESSGSDNYDIYIRENANNTSK
jgi:miniconductance mechanosensitive channel